MTETDKAETERKTFDQQVCDELRDAAAAVLLRHPEVRTVSSVVSWKGALNDAPGVQSAVWLSEDGPVRTLDAIVGSVYQTLHLLEAQMQRAEDWLEAFKKTAIDIHASMRQGHESKATPPAGNPPVTSSDGAAAGGSGDSPG